MNDRYSEGRLFAVGFWKASYGRLTSQAGGDMLVDNYAFDAGHPFCLNRVE